MQYSCSDCMSNNQSGTVPLHLLTTLRMSKLTHTRILKQSHTHTFIPELPGRQQLLVKQTGLRQQL